jgi:hypothetical protein
MVPAVVATAPATAHAQQARAYIEKFVGWSKDGTFYAITEAAPTRESCPRCA